MFCHKCGNELPETAKFCPTCGTEVLKKQQTSEKIHSLVKHKSKADGFRKEQTGIGQVPLFKKIADIKQNGKKVLAVACIALVVVAAISGNGNNRSSSSSGSSSGSSSFFSDRKEPKKILDCLTCDGDGDCNTCGGYGRENFYAGAGDYVDAVCSTCHGSGDCRTCGGSGKR